MTQDNKTTTGQSKPTTKKTTLLSAIEKVIMLAIGSHYSTSFMTSAKKHLNYIATRLDMTTEQALLFSLLMERSTHRRTSTYDLALMLGCHNIRILSMLGQADPLIKRGYINKHLNDSEIQYSIPRDVVEAIKQDREFTPEPRTGLSIDTFMDFVDNIFDGNDGSPELICELLDELIADNQHLPFCIAIKKYNIENDDYWSRLLLCVYASRLINHDDDMVGEVDWEDYFHSKCQIRQIRHDLKEDSHPLRKAGLIEPNNHDGMGDTRFFHLTNDAKEELFPGMGLVNKNQDLLTDIIPYDSFAQKQLFYNPAEKQQIDQLTSLLMPEQFSAVTERLAENGMRKGFACLFYGSPGTGKTETVNQLARLTGRNVLMVDVSKIKSCWVGESEKNIKAAFDRYRKLVEQQELAPILLFNEADAVLGKRSELAERSVDKMENAIQNIILQEMEQLEGIMIATTNLTQNLDAAFERRFIYKIEFHRPSLEAKRAIWQTMIPTLDSSAAQCLAREFDFSGGQIENIARKRTVESILKGKEPSLDDIRSYCRAEHISSANTPHRRIGF